MRMEKRKSRRKIGELKAAAHVASDAESTVSTRSSTSNSSNTSSKQKQGLLTSRESRSKEECKQMGDEDDDDQNNSLEARLGAILETTEVQLVMILLIALDVCCSALEIHLRDQQQLAVALQQLKTDGKQSASTEVAVSLLVRVVTRLVESFTGFTLFLFLIELIILLAAFRQKFFAHAGYMMDLAVVSLSLVVELYTQTKAARLLGILRVWRVLRLVRRLVDHERAAHDATRLLLEQEQLKFLHVRMQKDAAHESLKREYESRDGIEQLLRGYKDEIVTLKEALQIAAQAVATITENRDVDPELYEHSESAIAENAFGSYPVMAGDDYSEEHMYYHQETAAVHPTELQTDLQTQYWQESEESESNHQEAAVVYPTAMSEVKEEQWQETEREDRDQDVGVNSTDMPVDSEEHCEGSESEFEDAVDS